MDLVEGCTVAFVIVGCKIVLAEGYSVVYSAVACDIVLATWSTLLA